jgi:hypothetical protein
VTSITSGPGWRHFTYSWNLTIVIFLLRVQVRPCHQDNPIFGKFHGSSIFIWTILFEKLICTNVDLLIFELKLMENCRVEPMNWDVSNYSSSSSSTFNINVSTTLVEGFMLKFHCHTPSFTFLFYILCEMHLIQCINYYYLQNHSHICNDLARLWRLWTGSKPLLVACRTSSNIFCWLTNKSYKVAALPQLKVYNVTKRSICSESQQVELLLLGISEWSHASSYI